MTTPDTLAKLAACPFCGSEALFYPDGEEEGHSIMCSGNKDDHKDCPISAFRFEATIEQASEAWNRHALTAQALPAAGRCDECSNGQADGWALYCVGCLEKTGLLAKEALPHTQHVSSTAADLTGPNDTAAQAPTLTDHDIETLAHRMCWRYKKSSDPHHSDTYTFNRTCLLEFVRKTMQGETR